MKKKSLYYLLAASLGFGCQRQADQEASLDRATINPPLAYRVTQSIRQRECCDGSAGVALDREHFLVANDEDSVLRIYRRSGSPQPLADFNFRKFLELKKKEQESDIEGLTRIGSTVYAIASHSRSEDGDKRKERRQFFALRLTEQDGSPHLLPQGQPFSGLIKALESSEPLRAIDFDEAAKRPGDRRDGLNVEGLTSTAEGGLLIAFRAPVLNGDSLLVPLLNPEEVINDAPPRFGDPFRLALGGTGVRGIERHGDSYILTTESDQGAKGPRLFLWNGVARRPAELAISLPSDFNPEAVLLFPDSGLREIHLLSDDGNARIEGENCNDLSPQKTRYFRRLILRTAGA